MRAADLFEQRVIPAGVARQVGVSHQIVSDWRAAWRRSGRDGLRVAGRAGRLPKLNREQLAQVEVELAKGAEANGYANDLWTLKRVAEVIERGHRRVLPPSARLLHLAPGSEVELAATGTSSHRAQRRSHPAVREAALAAPEQKGKAPERADRVRGRVRGVAAAVAASDVGTHGDRHRGASSVPLETAVAGWCVGRRTGWQRCAPLLRIASWRLQRRTTDRVPERDVRGRATPPSQHRACHRCRTVPRTSSATRLAPRGPGTFADARRALQPGAFPPWPPASPSAPAARLTRWQPIPPRAVSAAPSWLRTRPLRGGPRCAHKIRLRPAGAICLTRGYAPHTPGPA